MMVFSAAYKRSSVPEVKYHRPPEKQASRHFCIYCLHILFILIFFFLFLLFFFFLFCFVFLHTKRSSRLICLLAAPFERLQALTGPLLRSQPGRVLDDKGGFSSRGPG
ncbi:hypothetical protein M440DRAFT_1108456 [Trichoderma longibrachiatum ATCC 18648]|uniref:Uncharacterized protein n=1 Tax=Trichoderma longibrachiatum ATCC 18648 TaxID=983965 RepID=A0A2T4CEN7_TRILO|nr:hypothetical protein M440DRAFT_1108456 [Trichoderma longibrachiatum ATCC 18648]